jgi:hypothetical protein
MCIFSRSSSEKLMPLLYLAFRNSSTPLITCRTHGVNVGVSSCVLLQRVGPGLGSSSSPQEREQPVARNARAGTRKHAKGALREDVAADATRRDAVVRREGDMSFARPDVSM